MDKALVIYKSKYGSTKKYAEWIAENANADITDKFNAKSLLQYSTIIYGGWVFANFITGFADIKKNYALIKDKKIIVFAVGLTTPTDEYTSQLKIANLTDEMDNVKLFYLHGAINYPKMSLLHKFVINILKKTLIKKPSAELTDMERDLLAGTERPIDYTDKNSIAPILAELQ